MTEAALVVMDIDHCVIGAIRVMAGVARGLHDDMAQAGVVWRGPVSNHDRHGRRLRWSVGRGVGCVMAVRAMDGAAGLAASDD